MKTASPSIELPDTSAATSPAEAAPQRRSRRRVENPTLASDLVELTKPRVNFLVLVTTLFGVYIATTTGGVDWLLLAHALLGTALTAASASVFNQIVERRHDARMPRTAHRPLASGRRSVAQAMPLAIGAGVIGVAHLWFFVNPLTSLLGLATLLLYVLVYTPLKRVTWTNTLIGAVPGAIPPLMGYTAVTNTIDLAGLSLFAILFVWQMPHFYAIAILYREDYARGGYRMLPVDDPGLVRTRTQIVFFCLLMLGVSVAPRMLGIAGDGYLATALLLGTIFGGCGMQVAATAERRDARRLFFASIVYLPLLLAALTLNKL
jgi:protoheme IX farnesyltransferase